MAGSAAAAGWLWLKASPRPYLFAGSEGEDGAGRAARKAAARARALQRLQQKAKRPRCVRSLL